jgi:hypothetical protein
VEATHKVIADALREMRDRGDVEPGALRSLSRSLHVAAARLGLTTLHRLANQLAIDAMG